MFRHVSWKLAPIGSQAHLSACLFGSLRFRPRMKLNASRAHAEGAKFEDPVREIMHARCGPPFKNTHAA
jgi:hypothetical protein